MLQASSSFNTLGLLEISMLLASKRFCQQFSWPTNSQADLGFQEPITNIIFPGPMDCVTRGLGKFARGILFCRTNAAEFHPLPSSRLWGFFFCRCGPNPALLIFALVIPETS